MFVKATTAVHALPRTSGPLHAFAGEPPNGGLRKCLCIAPVEVSLHDALAALARGGVRLSRPHYPNEVAGYASRRLLRDSGHWGSIPNDLP